MSSYLCEMVQVFVIISGISFSRKKTADFFFLEPHVYGVREDAKCPLELASTQICAAGDNTSSECSFVIGYVLL